MNLQELFDVQSLEEGPNDPHIGKAIIMIGSPGSGKSFVVNEIIKGTGLKVVNSDIFYEYFAKKNNLDLLKPGSSPEHIDLRRKAWDLKDKQMNQFINGHLGLVLDGTGRVYDKVIKNAKSLKELGYDVLVVAVNTDLETSLMRNQKRERKVPEDFLKQTHKEIANNLGKFQNYFGNNMLIVDNSNGSGTDFNKVWKQIQRFINIPNKKKLGEDFKPKIIPVDVEHDIPDQHEKDKLYAVKLAKFIEDNCQFWLSQTDNGNDYVLRGSKSIERNENELAFIKNVRTNRKPKDSAEWQHHRFNQIISDSGKIANRSNSMFVTHSNLSASAYSFPKTDPFVVLPIGKFNYTWSKLYSDWSEEINDDFNLSKLQSTIRGDDNTLKQAIASNNEIMIKCNSAIYINQALYTRYVLPILKYGEINENI